MKTKIALIATLMLICFAAVNTTVNAQASGNEKAKLLMNNYEFVKAIALYNESFKTSVPSSEDLRNISYCYLQVNDTKKAKEYIEKLSLLENPSPKDVLQYGHLLKTEAEYDQAIAQYERYKKMVPDDPKVKKLIESCVQAKLWMNNPTYFQVTNLKELNTENAEFGMMPFGNDFIFTSDRKMSNTVKSSDVYGWTGNPYLKLYNVRNNEKFNEINAVDPLNGEFHNGPSTTISKENEVYYTRTKMVKVRNRTLNNDPTSWVQNVETPDYENRLEIYFAKAIEGEWSQILPFRFNKPEEYSVGHPTLSPDGKILYFASDMPGGFGGTDIYFCIKIARGNWSIPQNAGSKINTAGKELFPFMDKNGVLYFASDGQPGMGGLDLFKATGIRNAWSEPENLKYPINSPKDDFSIYYNEAKNVGFLSSNRDGGKGSDDIYRLEFAPPTDLTLVVTVKEQDKNNVVKPLDGVDLKLSNITNVALISTFNPFEGKFYADIKCNNSYSIVGSKEGYFTKSENIDAKCVTYHDTIFVELIMVKLEIDVPIVLKNIYYDFDKSFIRPDAKPDLDKLVQIMKDNPDIIVELGSHTDSRGSDDYNMALSDRRAKAAVEYIISKGISKARIKAKGYGESVLLNECKNDVPCSEEQHQLNRRTEFKVIGFIKGKKKEIKSIL